MSVQKFILAAVVVSFALVSCQKEEIQPTVPVAPAVETGVSTSIDDDVNQRSAKYAPRFNEDAEVVLSPCGNSFNADVRIGNSVVTGTYYYEIRKVGSNELVDSGMIGHGGNTNPVLTPCTNYSFKFFGAPGTSHSATQLLSSDGCGGIYEC